MKMEKLPLREEAQVCRRRAHSYVGLPEATFLIDAAKAFDDLAGAEERDCFASETMLPTTRVA